ncbi:MAG: hypothetical protein HZC02_01485 [Candidatus Levybacteria bacterium]|nr:hypothetical protein [Candidatus Levybacteria bacterium]
MEQRRSVPGQPIEEKPSTSDQNVILHEMIERARREIDAIPMGEFQSGQNEPQVNPLDD